MIVSVNRGEQTASLNCFDDVVQQHTQPRSTLKMPKIQTLLVVASFLLAACHEAPPVVNQPGGVDATAKLGDGAYLLSSVTVTTPTETNTFNRAQMKIYSQHQ